MSSAVRGRSSANAARICATTTSRVRPGVALASRSRRRRRWARVRAVAPRRLSRATVASVSPNSARRSGGRRSRSGRPSRRASCGATSPVNAPAPPSACSARRPRAACPATASSTARKQGNAGATAASTRSNGSVASSCARRASPRTDSPRFIFQLPTTSGAFLVGRHGASSKRRDAGERQPGEELERRAAARRDVGHLGREAEPVHRGAACRRRRRPRRRATRRAPRRPRRLPCENASTSKRPTGPFHRTVPARSISVRERRRGFRADVHARPRRRPTRRLR